MEILRVEHSTKRYGQGEAQVGVLDDVSFRAEQGEFVVIVGPSGSDKSTLLHLLGGVNRPAGGKAYASDRDTYILDETALAIFRRRQVGLTYQSYNLTPVLSVEENITFPPLLDDRSVNTQQLGSMVKALRLEKRLQYLPSQLSGGQQQRAFISRALMASPAIILADGPTGDLDRANSREIIDLLRRLHDGLHQTLVIVTHDEGIALQIDRTSEIEDGHIVRNEVIRR